MMIEKVGWYGKARRSVLELIDASLPREEQISMPFLTVMSARRCVDFLSYHDDDGLIGTSYSTSHGGHAFLLYLAISPDRRSEGHGTRILAHLISMYDGVPLTLNVEPLDPSSDNNSQRERRFSFYLRNGFSDTGYQLIDGDMRYTVLSTAKDFDPEGYRAVLRSLMMGMNRFKVVAKDANLSHTL